jgi:hypothetical protein
VRPFCLFQEQESAGPGIIAAHTETQPRAAARRHHHGLSDTEAVMEVNSGLSRLTNALVDGRRDLASQVAKLVVWPERSSRFVPFLLSIG